MSGRTSRLYGPHCVIAVVGVNKRRVDVVDGICWSCCIRRGRAWRLVIRGAPLMVVFFVCIAPKLRSFGGGCEQASGKRCRWFCLVVVYS